jgi:hypothetical protein
MTLAHWAAAPCFDYLPSLKKLSKSLFDVIRYLESNTDSVPDYGQRYRTGRRISTGFVESAVNERRKAHGEKTADEVESLHGPALPRCSHPHTKRNPRRCIPSLASRLSTNPKSTGRCRSSLSCPQLCMLSLLRNEVPPLPDLVLFNRRIPVKRLHHNSHRNLSLYSTIYARHKLPDLHRTKLNDFQEPEENL